MDPVRSYDLVLSVYSVPPNTQPPVGWWLEMKATDISFAHNCRFTEFFVIFDNQNPVV